MDNVGSELLGLVWVLEDSPLEAEMTRRALAPAHSVEHFEDGIELLERIANGDRPDALIVDLALPSISGLDVCRTLRPRYDQMTLPILILTSLGRRDDIVEGLAVGANDYLMKPYNVIELRARVGALVRMSLLHAAQRRRASHLALLADLASTLALGGTVGEVAHRCVGILATQLPAVAGIWHMTGGEPQLLAISGASDDEVRGVAALAALIPQGQPLVRSIDSSEAGLPVPTSARGKTAAFVGFQLVTKNGLPYALTLCTTTPLEAEVLALLQTMSGTIAIGLERARIEAVNADLLVRERAARAEAESANRAKDEFLAVVSHELRTPLNAITGWARMLTSGQIPPERSNRALQVIDRNASAQAQIIDDLLDISRIVNGKLTLMLVPTDVVNVIEMAREALRPSAESKGIEIVAELGTDPCVVQADVDRLQQVVWNLLSNAVKFSNRGGRVTVRVIREHEHAVIVVQDTGQGIAPEFLPYVFDRFRQADATKRRTHGGLGLGLAIVRNIVEAHGGGVDAESPGIGQGATFRVRLVRSDVQRFIPHASELVADGGAALKGARVLVVEDDPDAREMLVMLLQNSGARVTATESTPQALEQFRQEPPDVLISDIGLPGEDGLSLIAQVRQLPGGGRLPAIALTAYARDEDRVEALAAGFDAHLSKPVHGGQLAATIAAVRAKKGAIVPRG